MLFGYPFAERKMFQQNFLRSVVIDFSFDPINVQEFEDAIRSSFEADFPRFLNKKDASVNIEFRRGQKTPVINVGEGIGRYQLISADGQSNLSFSSTSIVLNISGVVYKNFEDVKSVLWNIVGVLPSLGVEKLKRVSMRKINIANFEANGISDVFTDLLQPNLCPNLFAAYPNTNLFTQNLVTTSQQDGEYRLNLTYGMPPISTISSPLTGTFVYDFDILCAKSLDVQEIVDELENINQTIYNVFSWITSEKLKTEILQYANCE